MYKAGTDGVLQYGCCCKEMPLTNLSAVLWCRGHLFFLKIETVSVACAVQFTLAGVWSSPVVLCGEGGWQFLWREGGRRAFRQRRHQFVDRLRKKKKKENEKEKEKRNLRFFGGTCEPFRRLGRSNVALRPHPAVGEGSRHFVTPSPFPPRRREGARAGPAPRPRPCGRRPVGGAAVAGGRRSPCEGSPCPGGEEEKGGPSRVTRWRRRCSSCWGGAAPARPGPGRGGADSPWEAAR